MKKVKQFVFGIMARGGEQTQTLPGGGFHGGEQTQTLPGGGFHGGEQTQTLPGGDFHNGKEVGKETAGLSPGRIRRRSEAEGEEPLVSEYQHCVDR